MARPAAPVSAISPRLPMSRRLELLYRKVRPHATKALQPEEAWVHKQG